MSFPYQAGCNCAAYGQWVPSGTAHLCGSPMTQPTPIHNYYIDAAAIAVQLGRIADALERLAARYDGDEQGEEYGQS